MPLRCHWGYPAAFSFHSVSIKDGKSNNSILYCSKPRISLIPESLFGSCQPVFESIINLWGPCLLNQPWAIPQDAGARTRKPQQPHNPDGMDGIISFPPIRIQFSVNVPVVFSYKVVQRVTRESLCLAWLFRHRGKSLVAHKERII